MNATPRTSKFQMMISTEERALLETLAQREGLTASDWIRQAIRKAHAALPPATVDRNTVLASLLRHVNPSVGMAFVPAVVAELGPVARELLVKMGDVVELRPESGMGRLTPAERAACPVAIDGTPLSWARIL